jgi:DNA polymerase-4
MSAYGYCRVVAAEHRFPEPIIHLDMDAFFVEVERLRKPELRGRSVVVGGAGPRGVVASASYEARTFGVRSAMPIGRARRLCPKLVIVPPDHSEYRRKSSTVFEILRRFTPHVEGLSIDEAFLDVGGMRHHFEDVPSVAQGIRSTIRDEVGLPSSAGIASNKLLAKLASQEAKPDGVHLVPADEIEQFLHPLPVRRLWGVGEATYAQLERLGVETIGDLAGIPSGTLERRIGATLGRHLHQLARGIDERAVVGGGGEAKSISVEVTYDTDIEGKDKLSAELLGQSDQVADRLRAAGLAGRTVTLKVRFSDFTTITRSRTLESATNVGRDIYRTAGQLLERSEVGERPVRLIGVGLSMLSAAGTPNQLATDRPAVWDDLADAVTEVRDRFGSGAVKPARLAHPEDV